MTITHWFSFFCFALLICSCAKDDNNPAGSIEEVEIMEIGATPDPIFYDFGTTVKVSLYGVVKDLNNTVIPNAKLTINGQTATTDAFGSFVMEDVNCGENRAVIKYEHPDYHTGIFSFVPNVEEGNRITLTMQKQTLAQVDATERFLIDNGAGVSFDNTTFVNQFGEVQDEVVVAMRALRTDDPNLANLLPGTDLTGIDEDGDEVFLYSYGMIQVELPNGVRMAEGSTAEIRVINNDGADAPAEVPLWYLDENSGIWVREGTATLDNGWYKADVTHFTYWNVDGPEDEPANVCIQIECDGQPVSEVPMVIGQQTDFTDASGTLCLEVRPNVSTYAWGFTSQVGTVQGTEIEIPPLAPGSTHNINATMDDYGILSGKVIGCNGSAKGTTIWVKGNASEDLYVTSTDISTGLFDIPIPVGEPFSIVIPFLEQEWGPYTLDSCEKKDVGDFLECDPNNTGDPEDDPDFYNITFQTDNQIPFLDDFSVIRSTKEFGDYFPCNEFIEMNIIEESNQYANSIIALFTYEDGVIDTIKSSVFPCLTEGVYFQFLSSNEWEVENDIADMFGTFSVSFESIGGTFELEHTEDDWVIATFDLEFRVNAIFTEYDQLIIRGSGAFEFYKNR